MFTRRSRYLQSQLFSSGTDDTQTKFQGVRTRRIPETSGVVEHVIKAGERLDLLARDYYNDDRLWWRILDANPDFLYGGQLLLDDHEGEIILIPTARN